MGRPEISAVVCHHTGTLLFGFLESIFKSTDASFEVIVMTSNRQLAIDGIKDCTVIHHEGMPAAKRNAGARIAKGKYLAFFDDDVTVDPLCLHHLQSVVNESVAMAFGKLWNMEHRNRFDEAGGYLTCTGFIWSRAEQNAIDIGQYNTEDLIFAGKSASCMVKKFYFDQVGGFDEDFGILGEESDLAWRLWLKGQSIIFCPQATGYHAFNTKFKPVEKFYTNTRIYFNGSRNYITMLLKNLEWPNLWIVPVHISIWFGAACALIFTGRIKAGINILRGFWYVLRNFRRIIAKRKVVQSGRRITDRALFAHIYRSPHAGYYAQRFMRYITGGLHG